MKTFLNVFLGLAFLFASFYSFANSKCLNADPNSVEQVFECVATATINQYNNVNPFARSEQAMCNALQGIYQNVLRVQGVAAQDINGKVPSCEIFAEVLTELNGTPPLWEGCLGYSPGASHMAQCLLSIAEKSGQYQAAKQQLSNCLIAQSSYETILYSMSFNKQNRLPDNYQKVNCDAYLTALSANDPDANSQSPCAGFDQNNVTAHAKKCLLADEQLRGMKEQLTCQSLRQSYQTKLIQVYGSLPQGFRLLRCSELDNIIAAF